MIHNFKSEKIEENSQNTYFQISLPSIIVCVVLSLMILLIFEFLPQRLPLFYSLPWGEPQLTTHQQFYIVPASILLITLTNLLISSKLPDSYNFFKKILVFSTIITTIILAITFIKIVLIFL